MSDPLKLLADQLTEAARRIEERAACPQETQGALAAGRPPRRRRAAPLLRSHARRARLLIAASGALLLTAGATLAATGVIPIGRGVRPEELQNPRAGEGLPKAGGSRLLPLTVADPHGGPPWGMRVVHTTRGDVCLQVGRLQEGQLGALGIDGAFHDDGRFHPIPADALPADAFRGHLSSDPQLANGNTTCLPGGSAFEVSRPDIFSSAGARQQEGLSALDLRNVYYGMLGSQAVSVSYDDAGHLRTVPLESSTGSYLIVAPPSRSARIRSGTTEAQPGYLGPTPPLVAITYRDHGELCELTSAVTGLRVARSLPPCPAPEVHFSQATPKLNEPIQARIQSHDGAVSGVQVSFRAPYAVTSVKETYLVGMPGPACRRTSTGVERPVQGGGGFGGVQLAHDVAAGSEVHVHLGNPFRQTSCGRLRGPEIAVYYDRAHGPSIKVGGVKVSRPPAEG